MLIRLAFSMWIAQIAVPAMRVASTAYVGEQASAERMSDRRAQIERQSAANAACHRRFMGQDYWPQPAIWKIADADTTVFLFGTYHEAPRDFEWRSPQLNQVIEQAQVLITEGGEDVDGGAAGITTYPPVADRLHGDDRLIWRGMMAMIPDNQVNEYNRQPTLAVALRLGRWTRSMRDPPAALLGPDAKLRALFRTAGKKVEAVENGRLVHRQAIAMPESEQRQFLSTQLRASVRPQSVAEHMRSLHRWNRGEPADDTLSQRPKRIRHLLGLLLDTRNAEWAEVLARRMSEPGTILVAVGAGHFESRGSLLDLLAQRGLVAQRISPVGPPRARAAWVPMPRSWASCDDYLIGKLPVPPGSE